MTLESLDGGLGAPPARHFELAGFKSDRKLEEGSRLRRFESEIELFQISQK